MPDPVTQPQYQGLPQGAVITQYAGLPEGATVLPAEPPVVEPETPKTESYWGRLMGDLNRRRGMVQGMEQSPSGKAIRAEVPLGEMFGYATDVRSATQGRATFTMEFRKYMETPSSIADTIVKKNQ